MTDSPPPLPPPSSQPDAEPPVVGPPAPSASTATAEAFPAGVWNPLDVIYGALLAPQTTVRHLVSLPENKVSAQLLVCLLIHVLTAVCVAGAFTLWRGQDVSPFGLAWSGFWAVVGSLFALTLIAGVIAMAATIFGQTHAFRRLLMVTAVATVPWLLYAPLAFFKVSIPAFGPLIAVFVGMALWGWNVVLFAMGLSAVYRLGYTRTVLLMALPVAMMMWFYLGFWHLVGMMMRLFP